jgi:uncharacterized protein
MLLLEERGSAIRIVPPVKVIYGNRKILAEYKEMIKKDKSKIVFRSLTSLSQIIFLQQLCKNGKGPFAPPLQDTLFLPVRNIFFMFSIIRDKLNETATARGITLLFACESGSRAWGFHSPDSDYDVRFAYMHGPGWYLSIEDKKEVIELPVNEVFDINGYDIRKLLKLFRGSNAKIYEWIRSPLFYEQREPFVQELRALVPEYYSPKVGLHHYLGLCRNTFESYLQGEQVRLKKYFYALRPVLAACWIVQYGTPPPVEFDKLRPLITDTAVNERISALLEEKARVDEKHLVSPDPLLHQFIRQQMEACERYAKDLSKKETDVAPLNALFRKTIGLGEM